MAEYRINYTQSNFTGGIIAAELYGRNDFNKVKTGLKKCTNWTIREAGGLEFRRGTKYLQTIPVFANSNFKMASLYNQLLFFCVDGIRYLDSNDTWQLLPYSYWALSSQNANLGNNKWKCVYWTGSQFIALGESGYQSSSTDGITWTVSSQSVNLSNHFWKSVTFNGTEYYALGSDGYYSTSTNGYTWEAAFPNSKLYNSGISTWAIIVWNGRQYIAIASSGHVSCSEPSWSDPVQKLGNNSWVSAVWNKEKVVALSKTGYVSTSVDGVNWTEPVQVANLSSHTWSNIIWDGYKFMAMAEDSYESTSVDGVNWTLAAKANDNLYNRNWQAVAYNGSIFVALGYSGYISKRDGDADINNIRFTELNRRLYYYDGHINLREIKLNDGVPYSVVTRFESAPTGASITSVIDPNSAPKADMDVYVEVRHEYTFSLAKDSEHETVRYAGTTYTDANAELSEASNTEDNKTQQVNVTITLTNAQASSYSGGKILVYKKYQGYFYFLAAIDIVSGTTSYEFKDKGQVSVDMSKTPKDQPSYLNSNGSIEKVNSVADYAQRLFLTRSDQSVTEIIFSEIGNTDNLAYSMQRNEDEAGHLQLPISNYDSWCKVTSGLDLILSTSYTISKVSGYGDLQTDTFLWDGLSKTVEPVKTRRSLIYTNASNRNIYDLTYNEYGQYDSIDLTLLVKYIFEQKTIKRLAFKDYPIKTIYVLCDDGELYCLTYIKDQNIYAWYKIEHAGVITDICVVNRDTEDYVYLVVNYDGTYMLEKAYNKTDDVYMDCCVVKQLSDITDNTITGLNIFEGKKVRVFDAGNNLYYGDYDIMNPQHVVEGGKTVEIDDLDFNGYLVEDGEIQLPSDIELVGPIIIGLPYYAVAETIPLEFSDQNGNSTIGRKKAVNEAYLRYGDSRGITYKTMGHEYDCGVCERDIADNAQFLERGQVKLHTVSEYKWDSTIKILQRQPYPARIESITLGLTFNDKS